MPSPLDQAVFLVSGPSAAGKSTVARLLAHRFPRGVHLEGDVFRRSIVSGRVDPTPAGLPEAERQLRLRYQIAVDATERYFADGFTVVLEDVMAGPLLTECIEQIRSRPLHAVVLLPTVEVLATREAAREDVGYAAWSIYELHDLFAQGTPRLGLWLDTSDQTPEQTVDEILLRLTEAQPPG